MAYTEVGRIVIVDGTDFLTFNSGDVITCCNTPLFVRNQAASVGHFNLYSFILMIVYQGKLNKTSPRTYQELPFREPMKIIWV